MTDQPHQSTPDEIAAAAAVLRGGGLVAFPTETVYGLGADARDPAAVAGIFAAKGRPADHPLIVHLADAGQLDAWAVDVPDVARRVAERFWPGPLTLILRRHPDVPTAVTGGQDTIGLRVPSHPVAHALLMEFGGGVAAPSANRFGRVSPTTRAHVVAELGDAVPVVLDGGSCAVGLESTILDLSGDHPRLLRPGAVLPAQLAEVLGAEPTRRADGGPRTPGRLPSHYAPSTPVRAVEAFALPRAVALLTAAGRRVAVLTAGTGPMTLPDGVARVSLPPDATGYGHALYATLATLDALGCDVALVERPPGGPGWEAVHDRLGRAEGVDPHTPRAVAACLPDDVAAVLADLPSAAAELGVLPVAVWATPGTQDWPALPTGPRPDHPDHPVRPIRPIRSVHRPLPDGGYTLHLIDASDARHGIPVTRRELLEAWSPALPTDPASGTFHAVVADAADGSLELATAESHALAALSDSSGVVVGPVLTFAR